MTWENFIQLCFPSFYLRQTHIYNEDSEITSNMKKLARKNCSFTFYTGTKGYEVKLRVNSLKNKTATLMADVVNTRFSQRFKKQLNKLMEQITTGR